jgi:hypothetical protein
MLKKEEEKYVVNSTDTALNFFHFCLNIILLDLEKENKNNRDSRTKKSFHYKIRQDKKSLGKDKKSNKILVLNQIY